MTCNEQGEGCRVGSHPLWCQEGEQQSWTRDTELPNVSWSKEKPVWSLWVRAGCVCVCHRCQDLRPPEEEPGRGAAEAHHALGGAAVHPGQQRLPAVAQPPGRHVSTAPAAQGTCPRCPGNLAVPAWVAFGAACFSGRWPCP